MLKVGLTGSIAVGKSFVLSVLAELGGHVIDADEIAREVVQPGTKGLKSVCDAFGETVLNDDGTPVRWPGALTRNLLRAVDFLPLLYGVGLAAMLANRDFKRLGDLAAGTVVVYIDNNKQSVDRKIPEAAAVVPPVALDLDEQRALLDLAERSQSLTQERFEELAELPRPLVGNLDGERAAARLLGMANHIAGRQ